MKYPVLILKHHGLKTAKTATGYDLPRADLYLDCRGLAEHHIKGRGNGGADLTFQAGVKAASLDSLNAMTTMIVDSLRHLADRRMEMDDPAAKPYTVCFICAYGMHRSVAGCAIVAKDLRQLGFKVELDG